MHRLGEPRDGADSAPLCLPCWRGRRERRARVERRELAARVWESIGEVEAAAAAEACQACGAPEPHPGCWLCGYSWLAAARQEYEWDQAIAAGASDAEFARIAELTEAEAHVERLAGWIERCRRALTGYEAGNGWGRPVELLADLHARDAAARSSARGRPGALPRVAAVMALDADYQSGRRTLPGRDWMALLADCGVRAVSGACRRAEALGWAVLTRPGRRLTFVERVELGRANDRNEWDLAPLHRGDAAARARFVPAALAVFGELLGHAVELLEAAQEVVDGLRARGGAWVDWPERVRRAQLRQAVAHVRDTITVPLQALALAANICTPHPVSRCECVSSLLVWGLRYSPRIMISSVGDAGRPSGRSQGRASRSPAEGGRADLERCGSSGARLGGSPPLGRPRTGCAVCAGPRPAKRRRRPEWHGWAYPLAKALVRLWPWLADQARPQVASTLGARLGPDWRARDVVDYAEACGWRSPERPDSPLGWLAAMLDDVLGRLDTAPPYPARRTDEARRQAAADAAERDQAAQAARRADLDARDGAAAAERAGAGAGRQAARAAVERARAARMVADRDRTARLADVAARTLAATPAEAVEAWPPVAQPGSGLPRSV